MSIPCRVTNRWGTVRKLYSFPFTEYLKNNIRSSGLNSLCWPDNCLKSAVAIVAGGWPVVG